MQRLTMNTYAPRLRAILLGIVAVFLFFFAVQVEPTLAQQANLSELGTASTLPTDNIAVIIARVIRVALSVTGIIFVCFVIFAGYLYLTAGGRPEPITRAKKIFQQSIIGLVIIFSAYGITTFIMNRLLDAAFTGTSRAIADAYSESLSGALGGGILDDHYPGRGALDVPRNTNIFVSFKEEMDPGSIAENIDEETRSGDLNIDSVLIYPTEDGPGAALESDEVVVSYDEAAEVFVFNPVEYLGSAEEDTNYTVVLSTNIEQANGSPAFSGTYRDGYAWTFEVSTEIDLTPPYVVSVIPRNEASEPRNITVEINFNEAMNPVATTGSYIDADGSYFQNLRVAQDSGDIVEGTWEISNNYKTLSLTTTDACGEDPCGDLIYCLPTNASLTAIAAAASLSEEEVPQADIIGGGFDGVVDAAANSLDGNNDGQACGSESDSIECADGADNDNYEWNFTTSDDIEDTIPHIVSLDPGIEESEIDQSEAVEVTFNTYLKSSTVKTHSVSIWPDPYYEFWFAIRKENNTEEEATTVQIEHPILVSTEEGGWDYWPVLTNDVKSAYQICMYPAIGPGSTCTEEDRLEGRPYCCNGVASATACQTDEQDEIEEYPIPSGVTDYSLPDNTETEL